MAAAPTWSDCRDLARQWLQQAVGNDATDLRPGQWEAIDTVVNRRQRLLVVQRTGWGKSVVYFLAARLLRMRQEGMTLIVSPLISLMRNQQEQAERLGVQAWPIHSSNSDEWDSVYRVSFLSNFCIFLQKRAISAE
jgi:ATP-dependent DNA helicase RecQ